MIPSFPFSGEGPEKAKIVYSRKGKRSKRLHQEDAECNPPVYKKEERGGGRGAVYYLFFQSKDNKISSHRQFLLGRRGKGGRKGDINIAEKKGKKNPQQDEGGRLVVLRSYRGEGRKREKIPPCR